MNKSDIINIEKTKNYINFIMKVKYEIYNYNIYIYIYINVMIRIRNWALVSE